MRIKISSFTPLFFPYTARYVSNFADTTFIQGFIPNRFTTQILRLFDFFSGSNIEKKALKRMPQNYYGKNIGIVLPEIYISIASLFSKDKSTIQYRAHMLYGWLSKRYLSDLDIFHVRSGSGRRGAIEKAKKNGAIAIADHSIAHPGTMRIILEDEYKKYKIPYEFSNCFWDQILNDCKAADYVLVNSDFVKKSFIENGYNPNKIKVIYLGVREDFWECKKSYKTSARFNLLFIGEFGFRKGCEYLLRALAILEKKGIDFKLTVIGPITSFQSVLDNYNTEKIEFKGCVLYDELKTYYATHDAFVFPSLCEGSTMAGMEAMSAGLPCIFTDNCGVPVVNGKNGLIVPIKDEQAIANAIELLYKNESLREELGINAFKTIMSKYKWSDYQDNIEHFYNEIIDSSSK